MLADLSSQLVLYYALMSFVLAQTMAGAIRRIGVYVLSNGMTRIYVIDCVRSLEGRHVASRHSRYRLGRRQT